MDIKDDIIYDLLDNLRGISKVYDLIWYGDEWTKFNDGPRPQKSDDGFQDDDPGDEIPF